MTCQEILNKINTNMDSIDVERILKSEFEILYCFPKIQRHTVEFDGKTYESHTIMNGHVKLEGVSLPNEYMTQSFIEAVKSTKKTMYEILDAHKCIMVREYPTASCDNDGNYFIHLRLAY